MRVIKFRVWDCELKEMIYDAQDDSGYESDGFADYLHQESRYKVMQFTGLLDKSGKEIWEGDIVKNEYGGPYCFRTLIVCWLDHHAGWALATRPKNIGHWAIKMDGSNNQTWMSGYEVIGNIYENPELLNSPTPTKEKE